MSDMSDAWTHFEKAVKWEEKSKDTTKTDNLRATALRAADRELEKAIVIEQEIYG